MNIKNIKCEKIGILSLIIIILTRLTASTFFRLFHFVRIEGKENVPKNGPLILASNHTSFYDPPLLGSLSPRYCRFLARESLFKFPVFGRLIFLLGAMPIKREAADKSAIVQSIKLLKEGETIIVFPEGTRTRDGNLGVMKTGVISLAIHSNATIVPATIYNGYKAWNRHKKLPKLFVPLKIVFHEPLTIPQVENKADSKAIQEEVLKQLEERFKPAYK